MTSSSKYIEVAVDFSLYRTLTYQVPESLLPYASTGKRVLVPFRHRRLTGYILGKSADLDNIKIKLILDVLDEKPLFPVSMIPFFRWTAEYYMHPIGKVIKCALPGGINVNDFALISIAETGEKALENGFATPLERKILCRLKSCPCRRKDICNIDGIPVSLISSMESKGWIAKKRKLVGGKTKQKTERYVSLNNKDVTDNGLSLPRRKIIDALRLADEISVKDLKQTVPTAPGLIKSLEKAGYITIFNKRAYRDPFGEPIKFNKAPVLTVEQKNAVDTVASSFGKGFAAYLLAGVTSSGKTEVYMNLAAKAIEQGYSVLVLVPEIALISQMERRFRSRFGECVAVLHSGLSAGERYDQWIRIMRKETGIVIGARSAIFSPLADVGIIIVDEEHDTSYKQEGGLRYNARDLAVVRAKLNGGVVLLGSATPSIQSVYNVKTKKFIKIDLKKRIEQRPLPKITMIDLRKNKDAKGIDQIITPKLYEAMKETLARKEQILLFVNRRGYSSFSLCGSCGEAIQCKNCDISLTLHQKANVYKCHYCGFTKSSFSSCEKCGSFDIKLLGFGSEKVETAVRTLFPDARVSRMDKDTTAKKGSILKILKGIENCTTDILIGTQMVAKGHDFPNITLVGIICADLSLNFPDFRAGERTFQLLAQVSGRAGRGAVPGRVFLQTYTPDHFSILSARDQDFEAFYNVEIGFRKALSYPPFSRIIQLGISGRDKDKAGMHALAVGEFCNISKRGNKSFSKFIEILGPVEAPLPKIAKQYRWQIMLKALNVKVLHKFVSHMLFNNARLFNNSNTSVVIDVDPFSML